MRLRSWRHDHHLWLLIVPLMILLAISYPFTLITIDTGRDWARAYQIASGQSFPLDGPLLKGVVHFGPMWFYLMGLFLFLGKSITVTTLMLGVLASLKFLLAFLLGQEILDKRFGLLWACALTLPSWNFMEQVTFTHFNFVTMLSLWLIYALIRYVKNGEGVWLAIALLVFSIALHSHPSTAPLGLLIPLCWGYVLHRFQSANWLWLLLGVMLFILPFTPYLISQYQNNWEDFDRAMNYATEEIGGKNSGYLGPLIVGILLVPAQVLDNHVIPAYQGLSLIWRTLVALLFVSGLTGLPMALLSPRKRRLLLGLSLGLLLLLLSILVLRQKTTFYMTYVSLPYFACLWALGVHSLTEHAGRHRHMVLLLIYAMTLITFTISTFSIIGGHLKGEGSFPGKLFMDVKVRKPDISHGSTGMRFPSFHLDSLDKRFCPDESHPLHLHGALALITDTSYAVGQRLKCDLDSGQLLIGGKGDASSVHLVGLPKYAWQALGLKSDFELGHLGIGKPHRLLYPAQGQSLVALNQFPPHDLIPKPAKLHEWDFTTSCDESVLISNNLAWYMRHQLLSVTVNGEILKASVNTPFSSIWKSPLCSQAADKRWHIRLRVSDPAWLDIYTLQTKSHAGPLH